METSISPSIITIMMTEKYNHLIVNFILFNHRTNVHVSKNKRMSLRRVSDVSVWWPDATQPDKRKHLKEITRAMWHAQRRHAPATLRVGHARYETLFTSKDSTVG